MKEKFVKMAEMLSSRNLEDKELGWLLINNYIKTNPPLIIPLEKGASYFITRASPVNIYRDVQTYRGREKVNDINVLHVVDRVGRHWSIREHWILEILPV
jgi:hypothetical protein